MSGAPGADAVRVHVAAFRSGTDRAANVARSVAEVTAAARAGARLVVLPEYAGCFDPRGVRREHAEPLDAGLVPALREAAAAAGVVVVAGTVAPADGPPADDPRPVNVVVAVDGSGAVAGAYRKVHLYDAFGYRESDHLRAGPADAPPLVLPVDGLTVGVMTCYDLRFPESARRLVDAGADVLVVPAAWAAGEHKADHWLTLLRARAVENTCYVLGAAQQGPGVAGDSVVVDPLGVVLAAASGEGRAAVADLRAARVAEVRERNPSLANRRYAVVPRPLAP